jgi:hypothetical protein
VPRDRLPDLLQLRDVIDRIQLLHVLGNDAWHAERSQSLWCELRVIPHVCE